MKPNMPNVRVKSVFILKTVLLILDNQEKPFVEYFKDGTSPPRAPRNYFFFYINTRIASSRERGGLALHTAVACGNSQVVVFGGRDGTGKASNRLFVLDITTNKWSRATAHGQVPCTCCTAALQNPSFKSQGLSEMELKNAGLQLCAVGQSFSRERILWTK